MAITSLEKVLREARKLPPRAKAELITALLEEAEEVSLGNSANKKDSSPETLSGMSKGELETLAEAILSPGRQRRLRTLLRKNKEGTISEKEMKELDAILEETDRLALLKARAQYTLQIFSRISGAPV